MHGGSGSGRAGIRRANRHQFRLNSQLLHQCANRHPAHLSEFQEFRGSVGITTFRWVWIAAIPSPTKPRPKRLWPAGPVDVAGACQVFDVHDVDGGRKQAGDLVQAGFEIDALHVRGRSRLTFRCLAIANPVSLGHGRLLWDYFDRHTKTKPASESCNGGPLAGSRPCSPASWTASQRRA